MERKFWQREIFLRRESLLRLPSHQHLRKMQSTVSFSHRRSIGDSADRMPEVLRHYWSQHERVPDDVEDAYRA